MPFCASSNISTSCSRVGLYPVTRPRRTSFFGMGLSYSTERDWVASCRDAGVGYGGQYSRDDEGRAEPHVGLAVVVRIRLGRRGRAGRAPSSAEPGAGSAGPGAAQRCRLTIYFGLTRQGVVRLPP